MPNTRKPTKRKPRKERAEVAGKLGILTADHAEYAEKRKVVNREIGEIRESLALDFGLWTPPGVPLWVPTGRNRSEQIGTGRGGKIRMANGEIRNRKANS